MSVRKFIIGFLLISPSVLGQVINLKGKWKFQIGDNHAWSTVDFNDASWQSIWAPSPWEDEGYNGYDGFAWYRVKFDGRQLEKGGLYYLNLGYIDDVDEVYVNGMFIGFSGQCPPKFKTAYNTERKYALPSGIINFSGENTIAVRVFDVVHAGGIIQGDLGIYEFTENRRLLVDLQGPWSFAKSEYGDRVNSESAWTNIMVPALWESQGLGKYDGFGWYKKTFEVSSDINVDNLVLLLGKIDDFDRVFLNGRLLGSTNDHRGYGGSTSYQEFRAYGIPPGLIRKNSANTIEVLVEDIGGLGGIYEGPVGIVTRSNYEKYFKGK